MINQNNMAFKIAIRNILVQPARSLMSIIGVMGCVALLVCAFAIGDTVDYSIDNELSIQFHYDINTSYVLSEEQSLLNYLDSISADYEAYQTGIITLSSDAEATMNLYLLQDESTHTTIDVHDGIVLSKSKAKALNLSVGDTILISSNFETVSITISSIIETSVSQGLFMNQETYEDLGLNMNLTHHLWITDPNASEDTVNQINQLNGTNGAWLQSKVRSQISDSLTSINTIRNTMVIFSILLSVVVLYNFALLNMIDRIRDIATLKVLGLNNLKIGMMLIYEMMILVSIGTICGLFLGYPFLVLVMSSNEVQVMAYIYNIKTISYVYAAGISLITALIFNIVFTIYIRRINMIESLKSIE